MENPDEQVQSGGMQAPAPMGGPTPATAVAPDRAQLVKQWCERVDESKRHFAKDFDRMRQCMQIARDGAKKDWVNAGKYTVPIINRHINQAVAMLYAKHPKCEAKRRKKMLFQLWDGSPETAQAAFEAFSMGDVSQMPLLQEIAAGKQQMQLYDNMARTVEIVDDYFMSEQGKNYKAQLKKMVRRTKVTGVGYVKLDFQRQLGQATPNPDRDAEIADIRSKIERIEEITKQGAAGELTESSPEVEELRLSLQDLEQAESIIVREGPVLSFPRSTQVIIDKKCHHLRTLAGADWIAYEYEMTASRVRQVYNADMKGGFKVYGDQHSDPGRRVARVWQVWDKVNQQCFTICDGYEDFLKEPAAPDVKIDRFWNLFVLVFNETEEDTEDKDGGASIYPPSDVWLARHPQEEYNRSREGLREHRIASRPYYVTAKGILEKKDRDKLGNHAAHEIIELNLPAGENVDISRVIQRGPTVPIDPNQYEVEQLFTDVQRSVGTQEANLGGTSGATATESSIAESSRMSSLEDNIDDLDEFLSEMARAKGQLYFTELSKETVLEIAGSGASWPDMPPTREQASKDLLLDIRAGSSGKPNTAADLANLERAMPFMLQLPGINPMPIAKKYFDLLGIDMDESVAEGLPSMTALNSMMAKANGVQPGTGDPATDPNMQGDQGGENAPMPDQTAGGPQPEYPV